MIDTLSNRRRHRMTTALVTHVVDVVDGNGNPVAGAMVDAHYRLGSGRDVVTVGRADADGRARFHETLDDMPAELTLFVDRESSGPHRFRQGSRHIVEM